MSELERLRQDFSEAERQAVYRVIHERRDVRSYRPEHVPDEVLWRILEAGHKAPSVGFMQPWNFIVVTDDALRRRLHAHFLEVNERGAQRFEGEQQARYRTLKLQGLLDAACLLMVTCDTSRGGPEVLGRVTIPETDVYSTCLAVQNIWLAARAEGVGVGWMSIAEPSFLHASFDLPAPVKPVALLTLGYPVELPTTPLLERVGWRSRIPLSELVFKDRWEAPLRRATPVEASDEPTLEPPRPGTPSVPHAALARNRELTKPPGSLGALEELALKICAIQGTTVPRARHRSLLLCAGDHGVTAEKVSAYRPEVTARMVTQFVAGGSAVCAVARQQGLRLHVADLGVDFDFGGATGLSHRKVRKGTRNFVEEPAMTSAELDAALEAGRGLVEDLGALDLLALGEMGIGNSTSAAAMVAALLGLPVEDAVGRGTGIGDGTRVRKIAAVAKGLITHKDRDLMEVLRCLGGLEIAALVGAIEAAARRRVPIVLDGYITAAAALCAVRMHPWTGAFLVAGHLSAEPGHARVLAELGLEPLLRLDMRLGEGFGAALAMNLVEAAVRCFNEMSTFDEANMPHPEDPAGLL